VLNDSSLLYPPPAQIQVTEVLPAALPSAWKDDVCTALSLSTSLSQKQGKTLPWKMVHNLLDSALRARFVELIEGSVSWPCEFSNAQHVQFKVAKSGATGGAARPRPVPSPGLLVAEADLNSHEIQNLGDNVARLFEIKAKRSTPIKISIRIEVGDGSTPPQPTAVEEFNKVLQNVKEDMKLK